MDDLEHIFSMLGEASTTAIVKAKKSKRICIESGSSQARGSVAGKARQDLEKKTGKKVVSAKNNLLKGEKKKLEKNKKK